MYRVLGAIALTLFFGVLAGCDENAATKRAAEAAADYRRETAKNAAARKADEAQRATADDAADSGKAVEK